jgi:hypothetical protein
MDSFLGKLKTGVDKASSTASVAQEKVIQEHFPKIVAILREKAGPAVIAILNDADRLVELARSAYQALPLPVRLVVKEQDFIDWVMSHQDSVIEALRSQLVLEGTCVESDPGSSSGDSDTIGQTCKQE